MSIFIWTLPIEIRIRGTKSSRFRVFRSTKEGTEQFRGTGQFELNEGVNIDDPPRRATTTFIGFWTYPNKSF